MARHYEVQTSEGFRVWYADDKYHALEQSFDAFPDEQIINVVEV